MLGLYKLFKNQYQFQLKIIIKHIIFEYIIHYITLNIIFIHLYYEY